MKRPPSGIAPVIKVRPDAPTSLFRQVYEGYHKAILDGNLRGGQRVLSTRALAQELGISRMPVLNAYAQLLAEGYFESRVGSGTIISSSLPERIAKQPRTISRPKRTRQGQKRTSKRCWNLPSAQDFFRSRGFGPFAVSQIGFDNFPQRLWNRLVTRQSRNTTVRSFDYGDPMGLLELRERIAEHLHISRGVKCDAQQIIIVSGSQQALDLTTRVLLDPGDHVWMEHPGYTFARSVFTHNGCCVVPVKVDAEGLNVEAGIKKCPKARAVLVTPSHQYPLGVTMSASRRLQLLDWAESNDCWIIEDDYDGEYRYEGMPVTSLQGLDKTSSVVYIGTFSKVLFPSLRLGYLVVPEDLVERFLAARFAFDICPPTFSQAVLADFIGEGHFVRHIRRMRAIYAERRDVLLENIREHFGTAVEIAGYETGMHLSILLREISDHEISARAARQNLWLSPLSPSYMKHAPRQGFILGFGSTSVQQMPAAIRKFRELVRSV
jgi:GntR family transcriptional regulator/MocR family aminotransferase